MPKCVNAKAIAFLFSSQYEEPSKDVQESQASCQKRLIDKKKKIAM